jgi:hypothetical protein
LREDWEAGNLNKKSLARCCGVTLKESEELEWPIFIRTMREKILPDLVKLN